MYTAEVVKKLEDIIKGAKCNSKDCLSGGEDNL